MATDRMPATRKVRDPIWLLLYLGAFFLFAAASLLFGAAEDYAEGQVLEPTFFFGFTVVFLVGAVRIIRMGLDLHQDHMVVRTPLSTERLERDAIQGFFKGKAIASSRNRLGIRFVDGTEREFRVELRIARDKRFDDFLAICEQWLAGPDASSSSETSQSHPV